MLNSLHADEADDLTHMKDRTLHKKYKNITHEVCHLAYPEFVRQPKPKPVRNAQGRFVTKENEETTKKKSKRKPKPKSRDQYLDETFIYPANHVYVVGSSKDSLSSLTYDGTQNNGGDILESQAFTDLWAEKAFYYVPTTGGENWQVPWSNS